jgi:hypothetical protein
VQPERIIDRRPDFLAGQVLAQRLHLRRANHILMVYMMVRQAALQIWLRVYLDIFR